MSNSAESREISLYKALAGKVAPYRYLNKECKEFNELIRKSYPKDPHWQLRLEAHHIIEKRFYDLYKEFFEKKGMKSTDDMPAVALHAVWHRGTPAKVLHQMVKTDHPFTGLTQELLISIKGNPSPSEMMQKYERAYSQALPDAWEAAKEILSGLRAEYEKEAKNK